jgi:hypothetical protein
MQIQEAQNVQDGPDIYTFKQYCPIANIIDLSTSMAESLEACQSAAMMPKTEA